MKFAQKERIETDFKKRENEKKKKDLEVQKISWKNWGEKNTYQKLKLKN